MWTPVEEEQIDKDIPHDSPDYRMLVKEQIRMKRGLNRPVTYSLTTGRNNRAYTKL